MIGLLTCRFGNTGLQKLFHHCSWTHALDYLKDRKDKTSSRTRMMTYEAIRFMSLKLNLPFLPVAQSQTVSYFLQVPDRKFPSNALIHLAILSAWGLGTTNYRRSLSSTQVRYSRMFLHHYNGTPSIPRSFVKCVLQFGCFLQCRLWPLTKSAFAQKYGQTHFIPDVFCNNNKKCFLFPLSLFAQKMRFPFSPWWCFPQDLLV